MITYRPISKLGKLKLDLAFDNVLKVYELQKDDMFSFTEILDLSLSLLVINKWRIKKLNYNDKANVLKEIMVEFINPKSKSTDNQKVFDFNQDSNYIYSSFMLDYGIDLVDYQGKLDWRKFLALFQGLSEGTKIRQVIGIRTAEIPEANKHNKQQIMKLIEAKNYYALEFTEEEMEEQFNKSLDKLASALEKKAVRKDAES